MKAFCCLIFVWFYCLCFSGLKDHINQVMASARTRISYPEITYCSISSAFRSKAINKSQEAILAFNSYSEITKFLNIEFNSNQNNFDTNERRKWYTIAHSLECGESLVRNPNGYIDLRFGQLRIAIFCADTLLESELKTTSIMTNSSDNNMWIEIKSNLFFEDIVWQ